MPIMDKELPEILVMEILLKLPVKSLMRFKCVCKSWYSSFQTSYFITNHRNDNLNLLFFKGFHKGPHLVPLATKIEIKKHGGLEFNVKVQENIRIPVSLSGCGWRLRVFDSWRLTVFGPCNGLLCLHDGSRITLWNPSTREVKLLPESPILCPPSADRIYFFCIGFGFDRKSDDYKILVKVAHHVRSEFICLIYLYSLNTNSWREIPHPNVFINPLSFNTYINGIYYWKVACSYVILSFDMAEEVFSTLPFPNFAKSNAGCCWRMTSFNEALATIVYPKEGMEKCYDVWVLNGYSWTKQLTIGPILGVQRPLALWKNGEMFLLGENDTLVMFDPCTKKLQDFGIRMPKYTRQPPVYAESIVPIKEISECGAKLCL